MKFDKLVLDGCYLVRPEPHADDRGLFARTVCSQELADHGLVGNFSQSSISFNDRRGTVRGMHFAASPHQETKLVRCTAGEIYDVLIDLRPTSATYRQSVSVRLSSSNRLAAYIPAGVAHGFQALQDATEVLYMIDVPFAAQAARGVRWNDPAFPVTWPEPIRSISERDRSFPDFSS